MQDPDFKLWLQEVPKSRTQAKCKLCQKTIELSNIGTFALKSHMRYKKHKDLVESKKKNIWWLFQKKETCKLF